MTHTSAPVPGPNGRPRAESNSALGRITAAQAEAAFRAEYLRYQYCFVDFFADHLADVSRAFGGDMQMAVILGIIGQVSLQAAAAAAPLGKLIDDVPPDRRGITNFRLADATGIPRETVRRKLVAMEEKGWVERCGNFWVIATSDGNAKARAELDGVNDRAIQRAARFFAAVSPLISPQEGQGK